MNSENIINDDKVLLIIKPKEDFFTRSDFGMNQIYKDFKEVPTIYKLKGYKEKIFGVSRYVDEPNLRKILLIKEFNNYESMVDEFIEINDCFDTDLKILEEAKVDDTIYKKGYLLEIGERYLGFDRFENEINRSTKEVRFKILGSSFSE